MMLIPCIGGLSISPLGSKPNVSVVDAQSLTQHSAKQLQQLAKSIAVKTYADGIAIIYE